MIITTLITLTLFSRLFLPVASAGYPPDRVALLADTQNGCVVNQMRTIETLARRDNDVLVIAGDVVYINDCADAACADARWQAQRALLEPLSGMDWHLAPGNHDYYPGHSVGIAAWERWVGARYQTFDTEYACFFLVDDMLWDAAQARWLAGAIMRCDRPWRVLVKHVPLPHGAGADWPGIEYLAPERFATSDVDVVIAGHQHAFAAWVDDAGRLNITLPAAGCPLNWITQPYPIQARKVIVPFIVPATGFGELEITEETLRWRILRQDGMVLLDETTDGEIHDGRW